MALPPDSSRPIQWGILGAGNIAAREVAKADPDGYSILAHSSALTISPAIFPNLTFDATKDLSSVLMIGSSANVTPCSSAKGASFASAGSPTAENCGG